MKKLMNSTHILGPEMFHNPGFSCEAKQNINVAVLLFFVIFVCFGGTIIILEMWNLKFNLAGFEKCLFWRGADYELQKPLYIFAVSQAHTFANFHVFDLKIFH